MTEEEMREHFIQRAVHALHQARKLSGLTQEQVATALGIGQAAISRWEHDKNGSMSLHSFLDYAMVCGMVPLTITFTHLVWAEMFLEENPTAPLTMRNLLAWNAARIRCGTNVVLDPKDWQIDF